MPIELNFDNSFARDMTGFYIPWKGDEVPEPRVVAVNEPLARELGLDPALLTTAEAAATLTGSALPEDASPLAMAYAGHQFGNFAPQLGDGRALLLGELLDINGKRRDLALKGSGPTPFSRGGDGKAVLGPVLREYLVSEAMHALGIPTTRALAALTTGETILREQGPQPGAVLCRVAASHIRVGTFEFFAARGQRDHVRRLADYVIARHYPELKDSESPYLGLFCKVRDAQADLVARWMLVGFVHGVMNTDNTTVCGETIDYGPCAFIDTYEPDAVFSSIDRFGRYAYANQPLIAQWNLARFAECLLHLIDPDDPKAAAGPAGAQLDLFQQRHDAAWLQGMRAKLGLFEEHDEDLELARDLFRQLQGQQADFTLFFRQLGVAAEGDDAALSGLLKTPETLQPWLDDWRARLAREEVPAQERLAAMNRTNPLYIPRNHKLEEALAAASTGDMEPFERMLDAVRQPFTQRPGLEDYAQPAPSGFGPYVTFCGT
jgi:serine/tyrosine/threonine adenylyltransferase